MIQPCVIFFQTNQKNYIPIQSNMWLWVLHIWKNHAFIIIIMTWALFEKKWRIKVVTRKTEGPEKWPTVYLRHIKIPSCHMVRIFSINHLTWLCGKCLHINHQNMNNHTVNVCCSVVNNVHVLIYQVQNHIKSIPMLFQQYVLMCIKNLTLYHACKTHFQWK